MTKFFAFPGSLTTYSRADAGASFNYTFLTQKERDNETGLDYFVNRYYSSAQGRFTSPDIFGSRRRSPQSWNRYSYVLNNPLRYNDPLGLQAQDPLQQEPKKIDDIVIVNHTESRSWFRRALKKILDGKVVQLMWMAEESN